MSPFGTVLRDSTGRKNTRLGAVQLVLAQSLFILFALSLRASFTPSPDTRSYDNFCNSISMEEVGFTVHSILFLFFPENLAACSLSLTLCGHIFLSFQGIETRYFPFMPS